MRRYIAAFAIAGAFVVAGLSAPSSTRAADPKQTEFFETKIRPILAQSCVGCHGPEKQKGKLRLDTREGLIKGGEEDGKQIVVFDAANPEKSMIVEAIEYKNDDLAMPPPKKNQSRKLPDDQIAAIKEWLKMGAPYGAKPVEAIKEPEAK